MGKYVQFGNIGDNKKEGAEYIDVGSMIDKKKPTQAFNYYTGGSLQPHIIDVSEESQKPAKKGLGDPGYRRRMIYKMRYGKWRGEPGGNPVQGLSQAVMTPELTQALKDYKDARIKLNEMKAVLKETETHKNNYAAFLNNLTISLGKTKTEMQVNDLIGKQKADYNQIVKNYNDLKAKITEAENAVKDVELRLREAGLSDPLVTPAVMTAIAYLVGIVAAGLTLLAVIREFNGSSKISAMNYVNELVDRGVITPEEARKRISEIQATGGFGMLTYGLIGIGLYFVAVQTGILKSVFGMAESGISSLTREKPHAKRTTTKKAYKDPSTGARGASEVVEEEFI